jgi:DNA topoisomerase-1
MTDPKDKPRTASLLSAMSPESITLEDAIKLLSLPRTVGNHPDDGEAILAQNGRYGPYLTWGKETRSLEDEEQIFTIDLPGALALLAQPKQRGRRAAAGPLKELGEDPVTKKQVVVRSGRFGLFVTDGEVNATLRLGDTPETITLDRACELLAERRNAEPSTRPRKAVKKAAKKATAKKAGAKKSVAKKATDAAKRDAVTKGARVNAALIATAQHADDV